MLAPDFYTVGLRFPSDPSRLRVEEIQKGAEDNRWTLLSPCGDKLDPHLIGLQTVEPNTIGSEVSDTRRDDGDALLGFRCLDTRAPAQAPGHSGETWGKCPEKARSRTGHALVGSWSCTGSCGLSM